VNLTMQSSMEKRANGLRDVAHDVRVRLAISRLPRVRRRFDYSVWAVLRLSLVDVCESFLCSALVHRDIIVRCGILGLKHCGVTSAEGIGAKQQNI
jgi:hypothetical protein